MNTSPGAARPRISVAIIARNAAAALTHTLQSIETLADEVIVVDTGSSDGTREAAASHGAQVVDFEWCEDFSAARNEALRHLSGDWVLWLDAGETLTAEDATGLRNEIDAGLDATKVYLMLVKLPPAEGVVAAEQVARLRLTPRDLRLKYTGAVRENMIAAATAAGLAMEGLPYRIQRGAADHEPQVKALKARRNLQLANQQLQANGANADMHNCAAEALAGIGEHAAAIGQYRQAIACSDAASSERLEAYYGVLTCLDAEPDARQHQIALCVEALEAFPLDAQLLCAMGGYLQAEGRLDLAERSYRTAFEHGTVNPLIWHIEGIREIAAVCLSLTLQLQSQPQDAAAVLTLASQKFPESRRVRRALLELNITLGQQDAALAQIAHLGLANGEEELFRSAVRGACLAAAQNWIGARAYLQTAFDGGCRDVLCLRWLTLTMIALQNQPKAHEVLRTWEAIEPGSVEVQQFAEALAQSASQSSRPEPSHIRIDSAAATPSQQPAAHQSSPGVTSWGEQPTQY